MKKLGYMEIAGEFLIVFCALLWISRLTFVPYFFALGTVLFSIGRLAQGNDHILAEIPESKRLQATRLLRQRYFGIVFLFIASALMFAKTPMHLFQGIYIMKSSWLVPFICFTVIEVYTAFRIPQLSK
jgi:hypothetical protein